MVRNRIVVPGHFPALNELDTLPGERITAYWESKARGGAGMICTGIWGVHPSSPTPTRLDFFDYRKLTSPLQIPSGIDRLKRTAEAIKKHGARFLVQLWHGGALTVVVYGVNVFGDAMRDLLDPRLRGGLGRYSGVKISKKIREQIT